MPGRLGRKQPLRSSQLGFWGAVAGMIAAMAIGCTVVVLQMLAESGHRVSYFRHRAEQNQQRIRQIERRLDFAHQEVARMRRQAAAREQFDRILAAPDGQLLRLEGLAPRSRWHGVVAISQQLSQAVLEVSGLPAVTPEQHYVLWWIVHRGPIAAAEFGAHDDGQPDVVVQAAPPAGLSGVMVTLERPGPGPRPSGDIVLKGELHKPAGQKPSGHSARSIASGANG